VFRKRAPHYSRFGADLFREGGEQKCTQSFDSINPTTSYRKILSRSQEEREQVKLVDKKKKK
jgi:hypothetical protein